MRTLYFKILPKAKLFPDPKKDEIEMIAAYGDTLKIFEGEERSIIENFVRYFREYDPERVIGFKQDYEDFPYLKERGEKYGIGMSLGKNGEEIKLSGKYFRGIILKRTKIEGRENIDLFAIAWRDFARLPTKEIDELADALNIKFERIPQFKLMERSKDERKKYLGNYVNVIKRIAEEIIPFEESISELCQVPLEEQIRMTVGELVDIIVVREMKKRGIEKMSVGGQKWYEGGYVWLKSPGVYEKVVYLDFQSMYPNIIRAWNISPETVDMNDGEEVEVEGEKHRIRKEIKGVIPSIIENFLERRLRIKDKLREKYDKRLDAQQKAIKVITNAMYGYMGWSGATYYNRNAARLIAALARYYIKEVRKIIENLGGEVIYIDTDGIQFVGGEVNKIVEVINKRFPLNIEIERIADKAVYWAKKKYAHLVNGKVEAVGLEYIRKDYPPIIKRAQKEIVEYLLKGEVNKARETRIKYRNKIKERNVEIDELAIVEQLTKKPEEYEKITKASMVAKILKERMGIELHRGTYVYLVIVKGSGGPTYRARPVELTKIDEVDLDYYLKMYDDTIKRTFEAFNVSITKQWF